MCCARVEPCSCWPASDQVHRDLLDGMHLLAQPLTMLETRLYLALGQPGLPAEAAQALASIEDDLQELCGSFRLMQQLLRLETAATHLAEVSASWLGLLLAEAAEIALAGSSIVLRCDPDAFLSGRLRAARVRLDQERTREAMRQVLCVAAELAQTEVAITVSRSESACQSEFDSQSESESESESAAESGSVSGFAAFGGLALRLGIAPDALPPRADVDRVEAARDRLSEKQRLQLAVARQGLRSGGCSLEINAAPFFFTVHLPLCDSLREQVFGRGCVPE